MNTTPETTSATGHSADHARDELLPSSVIEDGAQALIDSGLWPCPDEYIQEFAERAAGAVIVAALPALRAEVLAPVAGLADEWEQEDALDYPADLADRLRAVLADPDAVAERDAAIWADGYDKGWVHRGDEHGYRPEATNPHTREAGR